MAQALAKTGQFTSKPPCVGGVGARHETFAFCLSPSVGRTTCTHCLGMALRGLKETDKQVRVFLLCISSLHTNWGLQHSGSTDVSGIDSSSIGISRVKGKQEIGLSQHLKGFLVNVVFEERAMYMAMKFPTQLSGVSLPSFSPDQILWGWYSIAVKHQELLLTESRPSDH